MANVQLPNIDSAETDIKVLVPQLLNAYAKLTKELSWLLNNLDTRNLNYVDGDLLVEGTVTAAKLIVDELSAISANLGHITAGLIESIQIYGSYIATRNGAFPRAEMNNSGDLLAVYTDSSSSVTIEPGITDEPTITFRKFGVPSFIIGPAFGLTGLLASTSVVLGTQTGNANIVCGSSGYVSVPSWEKFISGEGYSLQSELDALWAALAGKADISHSHSVTIPNHNHGNPDNLNSGGGTFIVS